MAVGQLRTVVVDCLEPATLAEFWSALLEVEDIEVATVAAEALGATRVGKLVHDQAEPFQVLLDPAGNEFCLVHAPGSEGP